VALHTHAPAAAGGGSAAEVLSKAFVNATLSRETHRAAEGTSFLKLVNQACDGAQEREVGGDMDTQTEAGMARSVEYCRGQCLGSAACRCFNLHNTTCSLHEGALTSTAMAGSSAYVRVAEKVVAAEPVDDGKGGKVGGGQHTFTVLPAGRCRLGGSSNSVLGSSSGNQTGVKEVKAADFAGCLKLCGADKCSCVDMDNKELADATAGVRCRLYFGPVGQTTLWDAADKATTTAVASSFSNRTSGQPLAAAAGSFGVAGKILDPSGGGRAPSAKEVLEKIGVITIPVLLSLCILWICCGSYFYEFMCGLGLQIQKKHGSKTSKKMFKEKKTTQGEFLKVRGGGGVCVCVCVCVRMGGGADLVVRVVSGTVSTVRAGVETGRGDVR
jgi:hypothetical protein